MKNLRLFTSILFLVSILQTAGAHWLYIADNIYRDSVRVFERKANPKANETTKPFVAGQTMFRVANGDTLLIESADSGFVAC